MYNEDAKMTYAIIAILIVVLAGIAYYLRSNSVEEEGKAKVSVITETKFVDTKKLGDTKAPATSPATTQAGSTTTNATSTMNPATTAPQTITGAVIRTNLGDIEVTFATDHAKDTIINFVSLAATHFYEGIRFHRVINGFMIQAGDPLSKDVTKKDAWGTGGPGYTIKDELTGKETYPEGTLTMARTAAPNSGGSQFFIVTGPQALGLPPDYTVFGKVTKGLDIAKKIQAVPRDANDRPLDDVIIKTVELK
jgi:cyclophilin family peptidyl-prolyl cis-trans isomerase